METVRRKEVIRLNVLGRDCIHLGDDLWSQYVLEDLSSSINSSTYVLVTDENIGPLYTPEFEQRFNQHTQGIGKSGDVRLLVLEIPPGEGSKSRSVKAMIEDWMLSHSCTRDTVMIALGGGVIGDLVGFVAATYMRGIRFVQCPTSLLAMVDSSIGGKTAIDTPLGKNLIGAIWQPERIYVDFNFLRTLPRREVVNGMAEIIKTAAIWNNADFERLEHGSEVLDLLLNCSKTSMAMPNVIKTMIIAAASVKTHVVSIDERESGLRGLLNFGHSIGHAIELVLTPQVLHGECVAIGMVKEAELSRDSGLLDQSELDRLTRCISSYGLPISLRDRNLHHSQASNLCDVETVLKNMAVDKKNEGTQKKIVILKQIGKCHGGEARFVTDEAICKVLCGT